MPHEIPPSVLNGEGSSRSVWPETLIIDDDWQYLEKPSTSLPSANEPDFVSVRLPHTWNAVDTLAGNEYRRDSSWYRKHLDFSKPDLTARHFLRFGAAGQEACVYVNGQQVGDHLGGYAAFTFEITDALKIGKNQIDVRVSNAENLDLGPIDADFNFYGGLYRSVQLLKAPAVCLSRAIQGGPGIRVWSEEVNRDVADLHVTAVVDVGNARACRLRVTAELLDSAGRVVSRGETEQNVQQSTDVEVKMPNVASPQLWSPASPNLYSLNIHLYDGSTRLDQATVHHGFRWYRFTNDGEFFLNDELLDLRGVNRHQDLEGLGNAVPADHHLRDITLIKELGANWLRLAHYQQDDYVLELCDRLGLLVWEEFPFVNVLTESDAFRENNERMLREMIEQHHNHPAIILWGVQNEILLRQEGQLLEKKRAMTKHLAEVARAADPRRLIVQAGHGVTAYGELKFPELTDVMGYNVYYGWYGAKPEHLTRNFEQLRQLCPDRPHMVSEYGAGSDVRRHSESPVAQDFSEEWQLQFLESYLDQFDKMPLCGSLYWNMFDFGVAFRGDSIPHVNQKGLVAFDHETKKDAWYLVQARWSEQPVLYLVSPRFTRRSGDPQKTYRVLSNFDEVELFHHGRSLGKQSAADKRGYSWKVTLEPGENQLLARGHRGDHHDQHGFVVTYEGGLAQSSGNEVASSAIKDPSKLSDVGGKVDGDHSESRDDLDSESDYKPGEF